MWFCVFIFWASITEWKCSLKVFWQLTAARARLNNNNIVLWICMAFCQGENRIIVCFYRWHEQRDGVRVLADRLLTRILVHSTFSDELWLWCFWTYNFEKYSVPCILRESQRREKPLGKLVGMMTIGRETEAREKVVGLLRYQTPTVKASTCKKWPCSLVDGRGRQLLFQNCSLHPCRDHRAAGGNSGPCLCSHPCVLQGREVIKGKDTKQLSQTSPTPAPGCSFFQE